MAHRKAVHARITGRVQGVWYRAWTQEEAQKRGLSGWVRNEEDGTVTALLCGPPDRVDEMGSLLQRGPTAARVDKVVLVAAAPPDEESFDILR